MPDNKCVTLEDVQQAACPLVRANRGGVQPFLIFGYYEDVDVWPQYPASPSEGSLSMTDAGKLTGDLTLKSGCRAYKIEFTEYSGTFTMQDQGERGGENVLMQLVINPGKIRKEILGFMNATRGRRMFFVTTDNHGNHYVMGDDTVAAYRTAGDAATTGAAATDLNSAPLTFQFEALMGCVYEGDVESLLTAK